ncbi:hypothetical protein MYU51_009797 [Penicillium brevicompactum]
MTLEHPFFWGLKFTSVPFLSSSLTIGSCSFEINEMYYVDRATWPQSYLTSFGVLMSLISFGMAGGAEWKDSDLFVSVGSSKDVIEEESRKVSSLDRGSSVGRR